uniref:Uncharacterized protein n=1 Tax=Brassica oleracea var. oleracea TaxID=109376 RepID=A0A0D3DPM4_BRAOL
MCEDGSEMMEHSGTDDGGTKRPQGVKATKRCSTERMSMKTMLDGNDMSNFQTILIAKPEPLAAYEEGLKKKLIDELMSN